jgi:circadian clock protein KaiB
VRRIPTGHGKEWAKAAQELTKAKYVLRLYIAGISPRSERAIRSIKEVCEQSLQGRYDLEIIDVYQQPGAARNDQIIAVPTLIKRLPLPLRRMIGDMADKNKLLLGLDLQPK